MNDNNDEITNPTQTTSLHIDSNPAKPYVDSELQKRKIRWIQVTDTELVSLAVLDFVKSYILTICISLWSFAGSFAISYMYIDKPSTQSKIVFQFGSLGTFILGCLAFGLFFLIKRKSPYKKIIEQGKEDYIRNDN